MLIDLESNGHHCSCCEATGDVHVLLTESCELENDGAIAVPKAIETLYSVQLRLYCHIDSRPVHFNDAQCHGTLNNHSKPICGSCSHKLTHLDSKEGTTNKKSSRFAHSLKQVTRQPGVGIAITSAP